MWPKTAETENKRNDDIQQSSFLKQFTLKEFSNVHHKKE